MLLFCDHRIPGTRISIKFNFRKMNVHEFQGKSLLKAYNVDIQEGFVAETPEQAVTIAEQLHEKLGSEFFVVKAQIHAGGRGKGG